MSKSGFSKITTWIIRILLFAVIFIGACIFMLSKMAGTSEQHRAGLEQGFSDFLDADVKIGQVDEFNTIPQLSIKVGDVHGVFKNTQNEFMADHLYIAFGFMDLMTGRRRIEGFDLDNFRLSAESKYDFRIDHAGIDAKEVAFKVKGKFVQENFEFIMPLGKEAGSRTSYYTVKDSKIAGHYGVLDIKGAFVSPSEALGHIIDVDFGAQGKSVGTGYGVHENSSFKIVIDCAGKTVPEKAKSDFRNLGTLSFMTIGGNCTK